MIKMYLLLFILGSVIIIGIAVHIDKSVREKKETERYRMQCRSRANLPETSPAPVKISRSTEFSCQEERDINMGLILSRLVDTFISKISLTMLPVPKPHNTACVLSWEEARRWQSRSSGYSSS